MRPAPQQFPSLPLHIRETSVKKSSCSLAALTPLHARTAVKHSTLRRPQLLQPLLQQLLPRLLPRLLPLPPLLAPTKACRHEFRCQTDRGGPFDGKTCTFLRLARAVPICARKRQKRLLFEESSAVAVDRPCRCERSVMSSHVSFQLVADSFCALHGSVPCNMRTLYCFAQNLCEAVRSWCNDCSVVVVVSKLRLFVHIYFKKSSLWCSMCLSAIWEERISCVSVHGPLST